MSHHSEHEDEEQAGELATLVIDAHTLIGSAGLMLDVLRPRGEIGVDAVATWLAMAGRWQALYERLVAEIVAQP